MMRDVSVKKGTPYYMSPEVLQKRPFDERTDTYSFGLTMWSMCSGGATPFTDCLTESALIHSVVTEGNRPVIPDYVPDALVHLICQCWQGNKADRPSMAQVSDRLEGLALDLAIPSCTAGRQCYELQFGSMRAVSKDLLLNALMQHPFFANNGPAVDASGLPEGDAGQLALVERSQRLVNSEVQLFAALLSDISGSPDSVGVEHFGQLLDWFGPFDEHMRLRVFHTLTQPWFHGAIEKTEAVARVRGLIQGPDDLPVRR
jgi:serine/threonine protein kinase